MFSGKCLKKRRESKRLSQVEVATQLGVNRSSYNSWKSGRAKPNQNILRLVARKSPTGESTHYFFVMLK